MPQFLVDQTPRFDELIMEDVRPTDGWLLNVSTDTTPMGTPVEITQDRFRHVWPNTTKQWNRVYANGPGCVGNPCDPTENQIGWGADRLTYYAEQATWATPLLCYDQDMHITHAIEHINQVVSQILRPATTAISSDFLRRRALLWAKYRHTANAAMTAFTYQWVAADTDGDGVADDEIYFDCSVSPTNVYHLVPQMLQNNFSLSMLEGYAGQNPFTDTLPFIELVSDMDTCWFLDKFSGATSIGGMDHQPNALSNWRFSEWGAANSYWRYGFSGQIGNYMVRVDPMGMRFNFVADLGAGAHGANGNRYRYQIILPFTNLVTTGAGGAAGIGSEPNADYQKAQFTISMQWHKRAMELLVPEARPLHPDMPFGNRDFGGKWAFQMDNLVTGDGHHLHPVGNPWRNKGRFAAWFKYYVRPLHYEFARAYFHKRELFCIPEIDTCNDDPGYPTQCYQSKPPTCENIAEAAGAWDAKYGTGVPTDYSAGELKAAASRQDGPIVPDPTCPEYPEEGD